MTIANTASGPYAISTSAIEQAPFNDLKRNDLGLTDQRLLLSAAIIPPKKLSTSSIG